LDEFARASNTPSAAAGRLEVAGVLSTAHHRVTDDDNDTAVITTVTTTIGIQRTNHRHVARVDITAHYPGTIRRLRRRPPEHTPRHTPTRPIHPDTPRLTARPDLRSPLEVPP